MIQRFFYFLTHHFKQPIFFYSRPWLVIGLNVVLSALIMIFYEPFGYHFDSWAEFTQLIGFCTIAFFCSVLFFICIPQEPHVKRWMTHWTIGKNCIYSILFLLVTGLSISFYDFHLIMLGKACDYGTHAFYICLLTDTVGTFTIGIVPLCIGLLLEHSYRLKLNLEKIRQQHSEQSHQNQQQSELNHAQYLPEKDTLNTSEIIQKECVTIQGSETDTDQATLSANKKEQKYSAIENLSIEKRSTQESILLTGDTKESLAINPTQIMYLEASGNYVNVYYKQEAQYRKILRTTIKCMEEQLVDYPFLVRCHRTYIININWVTHLNRNTQGYHLNLRDSLKEIPVSRTYLKELKLLLKL